MSEKEEILEAIRETGGTVEANGKIRGGKLARVARKLGIARKTLYNRMKALGLRGTSGRPKKKFGRRAKGYAAVAAPVAAVAVAAALLYRRKSA